MKLGFAGNLGPVWDGCLHDVRVKRGKRGLRKNGVKWMKEKEMIFLEGL
jgi:hypothetical protein